MKHSTLLNLYQPEQYSIINEQHLFICPILTTSLSWTLSFHFFKKSPFNNIVDFWHFVWFRLKSFTAPSCPHSVLPSLVGPPTQWGKKPNFGDLNLIGIVIFKYMFLFIFILDNTIQYNIQIFKSRMHSLFYFNTSLNRLVYWIDIGTTCEKVERL